MFSNYTVFAALKYSELSSEIGLGTVISIVCIMIGLDISGIMFIQRHCALVVFLLTYQHLLQ